MAIFPAAADHHHSLPTTDITWCQRSPELCHSYLALFRGKRWESQDGTLKEVCLQSQQTVHNATHDAGASGLTFGACSSFSLAYPLSPSYHLLVGGQLSTVHTVVFVSLCRLGCLKPISITTCVNCLWVNTELHWMEEILCSTNYRSSTKNVICTRRACTVGLSLFLHIGHPTNHWIQMCYNQ